MDIDLELLKTFKVVAHNNSISKAAEILCVTQPSISKAIKKLEEELKITLFIRKKKGMKLTANGKKLYNQISDAITTLEKTIELAKGINELESGSLKVGASLSVSKYILIDAITDFKKLYPNINISLKNADSNELYDKLRDDKLDLIFVNSTLDISDNYIIEKVFETENCFFVSKKYYEKIKNVDNLEEFILKNMIIQNVGFDTRDYFKNKCLKNNMKFKPILEARNSMIVDFVLKDFGVGFSAKQYIMDYIKEGKLIILDTKFKLDKRNILAVYKNTYNKKISKLLEIINFYVNKKNSC